MNIIKNVKMIKYLKLNFSIILSAAVLFLAVLKSFNFPYATLLLFLLFFLSVLFAFFVVKEKEKKFLSGFQF